MKIFLPDESATNAFGIELADTLLKKLKPDTSSSILITLEGELGAGKTTLVRACLRHLGVIGPIKSPTYTLLEPYDVEIKDASRLKIAHLDLYRLQEAEELDYIGGRDLKDNFNLLLVEWPKKAQGFLPKPNIKIQLNHEDTGRSIEIESQLIDFKQELKSLKNM